MKRLIRRGVSWSWKSKPPVFKCSHQSHSKVLDTYVKDLFKRGVISRTSNLKFQGRLFQVPKKNSDKRRTILDLSILNTFIVCKSFKMTTFKDLKAIIPEGSWAATLDMQDAYWHIPVKPYFRQWLGFKYRKHKYSFNCLPFGLNVAPGLFTNICKPILKYLHDKGVSVSAYLDDWIIWGTSKENCDRNIKLTVEILIHLGFLINTNKSNLSPSQHISYIGYVWNFDKFTCKLSMDFIFRFKKCIKEFLCSKFTSKRQIERVSGMLNFAASIHPFLNPLNKAFISPYKALSCNKLRDKKVIIKRCSKTLLIKVLNFNLHSHLSLKTHSSQYSVFTDASKMGWGVHCNDILLKGTWSPLFAKFHINILELIAVYLALKKLHFKIGSTVTVFSDNSTVVGILNKGGSARSFCLNSWVMSIFTLLQAKKLKLLCRHIQGFRNVVADILSRDCTIASEWALQEKDFLDLLNVIDFTPQVDLFATILNKKIDKYVAPYRDGKAIAVDAMSIDWNMWNSIYLFPPTSLLPRILPLLRIFKGRILLITPFWVGRPWWPALVNLFQKYSLIKVTLEQKIGETTYFNSSNQWHTLAVWIS